MAMLVIARQGLNWNLPLFCISSGIDGSQATTIHVRYANGHDLAVCQWTTFLVTCATVTNPTHFVLGAPFWEPVKIAYGIPSTIERDVVVCYSPLFLNERWQLLFAAIEVHHHYGASLQVVYIQSILSNLMKILRGYEEDGLVQILPWFKVSLYRTIQLRYNPNHEMEWRNQLAAHTDCLYKHKERTKFIIFDNLSALIFGDIDDIMIPRLRPTFVEEFRLWSKENPSAAFFQYERVQSYLTAASDPANFNLTEMLTTQQIEHHTFLTEKYAAIPSRVLTAWLHWPVLLSGFYNHYDIPEEQNFMFHWRHFNFTKTGKSESTVWTIAHPIVPLGYFQIFNEQAKSNRHFAHAANSSAAFRAINDRFFAFIARTHARTRAYNNLSHSEIYFKRVEQCYDSIYYRDYWDDQQISNCPGPFKCAMPAMPGVRCTQASNVYRHTALHDTYVISVLAYSEFVEHDDGCRI